jgi:hypothetical protein
VALPIVVVGEGAVVVVEAGKEEDSLPGDHVKRLKAAHFDIVRPVWKLAPLGLVEVKPGKAFGRCSKV